MNLLTIVVVNYNPGNRIRDCLRSIYSQGYAIDFETILVDNHSSDDSLNIVKREFPQVRIIENQTNIGFSRANNIAIRNSRSKYILLLNCDALLLPNFFKAMLKRLEDSSSIGLAGCRLLDREGRLQESFNRVPSIISEFLRKFVTNRYIDNKDSFWGSYIHRKYQKEHDVDCISGACMLIRREAIEETGLFDEKYFLYFEDADLCVRLKRKGWRVIYTPEAQVIHIGGVSAATNSEKVKQEYRKSQLYFYNKHHSIASLIILRFYLSLRGISLFLKKRLLAKNDKS